MSSHVITLDGITLASSTTVRNCTVIFDQDLTFDSHIKQVSRTPSFPCIVWPKVGTSCLRVMQTHWSIYLLLLNWTTAAPNYSAILLWKPPADPKCCRQSSDEN